MKSIETATITISTIITIIAYWLIWEIASYVIENRFAPVFSHHQDRPTVQSLGLATHRPAHVRRSLRRPAGRRSVGQFLTRYLCFDNW